jgi:outer membrane protein assembly factor BamB
MLFFGAADGNFYALNMAAGTLAWKNQVDTYNLISKVNNDNITLTTYTIQVDAQNQRLYWSFGVTKQLGTNSGDKHDTYTGTVCSLDLATGNVVWTRQLEDSGVFCSPPVGMVVNKDTLYLTENTALWVFFSASNGNLARTQHFDHYVLPPVMSNNQVFVASDLQLTAYGYH